MFGIDIYTFYADVQWLANDVWCSERRHVQLAITTEYQLLSNASCLSYLPAWFLLIILPNTRKNNLRTGLRPFGYQDYFVGPGNQGNKSLPSEICRKAVNCMIPTVCINLSFAYVIIVNTIAWLVYGVIKHYFSLLELKCFTSESSCNCRTSFLLAVTPFLDRYNFLSSSTSEMILHVLR